MSSQFTICFQNCFFCAFRKPQLTALQKLFTPISNPSLSEWAGSMGRQGTLLFWLRRFWFNHRLFHLRLACIAIDKGSHQKKKSVKVGNLAQGGGGSDPIPTFINHCFYGILDLFLPKISEKFTEKIPTFGEGGSSRLGQIPNFYQKIVLGAPLREGVKREAPEANNVY